jgi:hypothetical protein
MRNTITRVDNRASKRTIHTLVGAPGSRKGEHSLDGDVQALDIERFEEYLGSLFTVFWCIQRRLSLAQRVSDVISRCCALTTYKQEVVVLGLGA